MQKSPLRAGQPTLRNASTLTENDNRASVDNSETDGSESMKVMPLALGQKTQVISWIHQFNLMRKMPVRGQMQHAQGEPQLGDPKLACLSFDLSF